MKRQKSMDPSHRFSNKGATFFQEGPGNDRSVRLKDTRLRLLVETFLSSVVAAQPAGSWPEKPRVVGSSPRADRTLGEVPERCQGALLPPQLLRDPPDLQHSVIIAAFVPQK